MVVLLDAREEWPGRPVVPAVEERRVAERGEVYPAVPPERGDLVL